VTLPVGLEELSDVRDERVVGVGVRQQTADRQQDFGDGKCRGPLVLQDVEADPTVRVDVTMVDPRREVDFGRLERVVGWEVDVQEEDPASVRRIVRSHDGCLPVEHVIADRSGATVGRGVLPEVDQFFINSFQGHCFK